MTRKAMLEANSEDEGDDLVPNLDLGGTFMTQLDEPGLYFIKVKNILSLKFKNNLIFHFIKEL